MFVLLELHFIRELSAPDEDPELHTNFPCLALLFASLLLLDCTPLSQTTINGRRYFILSYEQFVKRLLPRRTGQLRTTCATWKAELEGREIARF